MHTPRRFLAATVAVAAAVALAQPALAAPDVMLPHLVSQNPADWTPRVMVAGRQDGVHGIAQIGDTVVVGGSFTQVSEATGPIITRNNIFAFDVTTGQISSTFEPAVDGKIESVQSAGDGTSVFIGGYFNTVNGVTTKRLAKLDVTTGQLVPGFKGKMTSGKRILDMELRGGELYVGGQFSKLRGGAPTASPPSIRSRGRWTPASASTSRGRTTVAPRGCSGSTSPVTGTRWWPSATSPPSTG